MIETILASVAASTVSSLLAKGMGPKNPYKKLWGPEDVENVNPYTEDVLKNIQDRLGGYSGSYESLLGDIGGYIEQAANYQPNIGTPTAKELELPDPGKIPTEFNLPQDFNLPGEMDPNAVMNAFLNFAPQLQRLADQPTASIDRTLQRRIGQAVGDQFQGNPLSGGFSGAMTSAMAEPFFNLQRQREAQRAQMLRGLYGGALSELGSAYRLAPQLGLEAATEEARLKQQGATTEAELGLQGSLGAADVGLRGQGLQLDRDLGLAELTQRGDIAGAELGLERLLGAISGGTSLSGQLKNLVGSLSGYEAQYGAPEWVAPAYAGQPGYMSSSDVLGGAMSGFGIGASLAQPQGQSNALQDLINSLRNNRNSTPSPTWNLPLEPRLRHNLSG